MPDISTVQRVPVPESQAWLDTSEPNDGGQIESFSLQRLMQFADAGGDISDYLSDAELTELGVKVVREWTIDDGSRSDWKERAEKALRIAAQEHGDKDDGEREPIWQDSAQIKPPLLTIGSMHFAAKASPDLIRGDQVVGVKVFEKPKQPEPEPQPPPQPQNAQQAAQIQQAMQQQAMQQQAMQAQAVQAQQDQAAAMRQARANRVKYYLNYLIFYKMDGWEDETDQLLHEAPVVGSAFKKIYMSTSGLCSDYVSALRLTVHNDTKSIWTCPRITQDFDEYPYETEAKMRAGTYRRVDLPPPVGEDRQKPRTFLEQHRMEDLDGDGLAEPYIVTVEKETKQVLRVEPAYTSDDVFTQDGRVTRIERWLPFASFRFLPDLKGRFYGTGFGKLLEPIGDSVETTINQLLDAGTAEIAGGGFISAGVRLQGSGTGGVLYFQPGEFPVVNVSAGTLQDSIWERTVPHPSEVSFKLLELMMDWGDKIMSTQDVVTGDGPAQAPVGTTYALQNQALMSYRACFKRMFRGFRDEFKLMYLTLRKWATDRERKEYQELTGGDLDRDFQGDGTDIQPIADPAVVTKMQKMARNQAKVQLAESELGMAAGMTQPKQAQKLVTDILTDMDEEQPEAYVGDVPPNPLAVAKAQDMQATAQERQVKAQILTAKLPAEVHKMDAEVTRTHLESALMVGELGAQSHEFRKEADRIAQTGNVADAEQLMDPAEEAEKDRAAAKKKPNAAKA